MRFRELSKCVIIRTAIPLILTEWTVCNTIANMLLAHAFLSATINCAVSTHVAFKLVRLVQTVNVSVASPITGNAPSLVAQETGTSGVLLALLCLNHLIVTDTLVRVVGLSK